MRLIPRFVLGLAGAVALALPAAAQTKWNLPAAYPADNFHTENLTQFAKDVSDATGGKLQITEEEARQYYQVNSKEFAEPATVTLREILIEVPTVNQQGKPMVSVGRDDEAAKKAADVRARLLAGEDFAKVAVEVSAGASKANGGLIGPIATAELSADLQKTLEAMKPGDITQPLRSSRGYQILKLETSSAKQTLAFEPAREQIAERVLGGKREREFLKYTEKLRSQAIIEWKNQDIKRAYDEGLKRQAAAVSGGEAASLR